MRTNLVLLALLVANDASFAANGDVDATFGTGGVGLTGSTNITTSLDPLTSTPPVVQPDGKIVACGTQMNGGSSGDDFLVVRFNADGTLDKSFSFDGMVAVDFDGGLGHDACSGIALQADGKIVVVGTTSVSGGPGGSDFAIARLTTDGLLDPDFGNGTGKTVVAFDAGGDNNDTAQAVAIQPVDQKIVVAGSASTAANGQNFAVLRLKTDGTRDAAFNLTGKVLVSFDGAAGNANLDKAQAVLIDAANDIVAIGRSNHGGSNDDFAIARLLPSGAPDNNFNANGRKTVGFDLGGAGGGNADIALTGYLQRDGDIVLAGVADVGTTPSGNFDIALVRLQPDGSYDSDFGIGGKTLVSFDLGASESDIPLAIVEQGNGKILLAGTSATGTIPAVGTAVRLNADGSPDVEFGVLGKKTYDFDLTTPGSEIFSGVALQGTQIIVSGLTMVQTNLFDLTVERLQNDLIFADRF